MTLQVRFCALSLKFEPHCPTGSAHPSRDSLLRLPPLPTLPPPSPSAHSQEYRDSSYINKTSFVENGFTSALGRALGYLGIGIDTSIASANEVQNAVKNQTTAPIDNRKWLTDAQFNATLKATKEQAEKVLKGFKIKKEYREQIINKFNLK